MLLAALGVGVFAAYVKMTPAAQRVPDAIRRSAPEVDVAAARTRTTPRREGRHARHNDEAGAELFAAVLEGETVKLVPLKADAKGASPMVQAMNATLSNLKLDGVKALEVSVSDRVATLDVTPALLDGMGSAQEASTLRALQMTLGQFKQIDAFEIRIEGEVIDTFGGHIELENPVKVIRPGQSASAEESSTRPDEDPASAAPR